MHLILDEGLWPWKNSFLVNKAFHYIIDYFDSEFFKRVVFGKGSHRTNEVHLSCLFLDKTFELFNRLDC